MLAFRGRQTWCIASILQICSFKCWHIQLRNFKYCFNCGYFNVCQ